MALSPTKLKQSPVPVSVMVVVLTVFCLISVWARVAIDMPNFKPMMALALFAGLILRDWRWAAVVPVTVMAVTDCWLGGYELPLMLAVYACLAVPAWVGNWMNQRFQGHPVNRWVAWNVAGIASGLLFFAVTNLVFWAVTPWYPKTGEGLVACFVAAVPFLRFTLLGNLFFVSVLGSIWLAVTQWYEVSVKSTCQTTC